jgi:ATP-dependent protease HslVU (ClpYQ) peptidase subunit
MKLDKTVLEALARLKSAEPKLIEWLNSRLESHTVQLVNQKDEVGVRWAQGRVQETAEIIQLINNAAEILRKADS